MKAYLKPVTAVVEVIVKLQIAVYVLQVAPPIIGFPGAVAFAVGITWISETNKLIKTTEITLFIFNMALASHSRLPHHLDHLQEGLSLKVGLGLNRRKAPIGVMFTRKDHPIEGETERCHNKKAEEKPPV